MADMSDCISRPLDVVARLYRDAPAHGSGDWGVKEAFKAAFSDPAALAQIPYVNADTIDHIPQGGLARYRGMIQDTLDPEYYPGAFCQDGHWKTTKFSDVADVPMLSEADMQVWMRKPLYCVAVPGESEWVRNLNPGERDLSAIRPTMPPPQETRESNKRSRTGEDTDMGEEPSTDRTSATGPCEDGGEKLSATAAKLPRCADADKHAIVDVHNDNSSPLPPPRRGDCFAFVYDDTDDTVRLNQVVEFVGVLSRAPHLAALQDEGGDQEDSFHVLAELRARPPTSQVPRLHVILTTTLPSALPSDGQRAMCDANPVSPSTIPLLRQKAVDILSAAVGGDKLVAEYLLLQLIARVHSRTDGPLGVLPLNIFGCPEPSSSPDDIAPPSTNATSSSHPGVAAPCSPPEGPELPAGGVAKAVAAAMTAIAARVILLPLSVPTLNRMATQPKRDCMSNRLISGTLQLPSYTSLILDECCTTPGTLNSQGIANLQALVKMVRHQTVDYDCGGCMVPMPSDVSVTIFSSGQSMLKELAPIRLPLRCSAPLVDAEHITAAAAAEPLSAVRAYISAAHTASFDVNEADSAVIARDITQQLKEDQLTDVSTFHSWITLARLLAISHGERRLLPERWAAMRKMERQRVARLPTPIAAPHVAVAAAAS